MATRNADFLDLLTEFRQSLKGDYVAVVEAGRFVEQMERDHPDVLAEWLRAKSIDFVRLALTQVERRDRSIALARSSSRAFAVAAESSDSKALDLFRQPFVVDPDNTRRFLAEMTGTDCGFVAGNYEASGNHALSVAAFFRALEQKAGRKKVKTVIKQAECERLLRSFIGGDSVGPTLSLAA